MSTAQDRISNSQTSQQPPQFQPDQLPPTVKVIECSCREAENKSANNDSWTNIIKEPIMVQKGSEMKINQSFIDMRGMDQDIIQFQSTGPSQDNSHTMLVQPYLVNDGFNNKTTTYDYIASNGAVPFVEDCGAGYLTGIFPVKTPFVVGLSGSVNGSGAKLVGQTRAHGLRNNFVDTAGVAHTIITITSPGSSYTNGDRWKIGDDISGYVVVDHQGGVTSFVVVKSVSDNPVVGQPVFESTNGFGLTINYIPSTNCFEYIGMVSPDTYGVHRGTGYEVGDLLTVVDPSGAPTFDAKIRIKSVNLGVGGIDNQEYFDQGYNYERAPMLRWAQTYDLNQSFSYGFGSRQQTFLSEGQIVGAAGVTSHHENDPCLSSGVLMMEKEDEFASGVFHSTENPDEFKINAPVLYFDNDASSGNMTISKHPNSGWQIQMDNRDVTVNGLTVKGNPLCTLPPGSAYQIYFEYESITTPSDAQQIALDEALGQFALPCTVSTVDFGETNTVVTLNSDQNYKGVLSDVKFDANGYTDIPNTTFTAGLVKVGDDDGEGDPTAAATVRVTTDAAGNFVTVVVSDGGLGHRPGMRYTFDNLYNPSPHLVATRVDSRYGWDFPAPRNATLQNSDLVVGTDKVRMFMIPRQQYNPQNDGNTLQYRERNVNPTIGNRYPISLDNVKLDARSQTGPGITDTVANGMYRRAGEVDTNAVGFDNANAVTVNHDTSTNLSVIGNADASAQLLTLTDAVYDVSTNANSVVTPYGALNSSNPFWSYDSTRNEHVLRLRKTNWDPIPLPLYRYVMLNKNTGGLAENHVQTGGLIASDNDFYYIRILVPNAVGNFVSVRKLSAAAKTFLNSTSDYLPSTFLITPAVNLNMTASRAVDVWVAISPTHFNTQVTMRWQDNKGSVGITGMQNYFGPNDPNIGLINPPQPISDIIDTVQRTYAQGGYYYLTRFTGSLTTSTGTTNPYPTLITHNAFNTGLDNFPVAILPPEMYTWRTDYQAPTNTNMQQSFTNLTSYWNYEPLYRQKTMTINKDFCVATDISGIWNKSAHALTGATNMSNGDIYTTPDQSGILQNEFIMPVYGSSNIIDTRGEYVLDMTRFSQSGGLEPGHCIARAYIQSNNNWLAKSMIAQLPTLNGFSYYNIFLRTAFTKVRGYDPLASNADTSTSALPISPHFTSPAAAQNLVQCFVTVPFVYEGRTIASTEYSPFFAGQTITFNTGGTRVVKTVTDYPSTAGIQSILLTYDTLTPGPAFDGAVSIKIIVSSDLARPDKTPLHTLGRESNKVGNTGKKTLDGQTVVNDSNKNVFELGEPSGLTGAEGEVRFGTRNFYPIYYLDDQRRDQYEYAKISQFAGSTEIALVFDTAISTFAFEYLHQPFTSAFVDDSGGQESVRVWFGNRKEGVLNHDAVGGLSVINFCRPDFPRGVFSSIDITDNPANGTAFSNGINPLKSVSKVGHAFLTRLGFSDNNLGIKNGQIDLSLNALSYKLTPYPTVTLTANDMDGPIGTNVYSYKSYDTVFYGTTTAQLDTTDAILAQIPAPESNPGLESHNQRVNVAQGQSQNILRKFGDFIFYPYGLNAGTNSFNTPESNDNGLIRYDNCTSSFGAIGGMLQSNSSRGMGIPNVLGSLASVDQNTIPVQLNPDCLLYTSYTIATSSDGIFATKLPLKLTNAYLLVLSSLMKETNLYMSSTGWVNSMAVANKTFIQGDYILAQGTESFYATEDFVLSEITTTLRDSNYQSPSVLGVNSSIIYQITNYNPVPEKHFPSMEELQIDAMQMQQMAAEHQTFNQGGPISKLEQLNSDFYNLGLNIITSGSADAIQAVRNQIMYHDIPNLSRRERSQFMQTPEGQLLAQNATDIQMIRAHLNDIAALPDDETNRPDITLQRTNAEGEANQRYDNIIQRTPEFYFQAPESQTESAPAGASPPSPVAPSQDVLDFFGDVERESTLMPDPKLTHATRNSMLRKGKEAIARGGYSDDDVAKMIAFGNVQKFREKFITSSPRKAKKLDDEDEPLEEEL